MRVNIISVVNVHFHFYLLPYFYDDGDNDDDHNNNEISHSKAICPIINKTCSAISSGYNEVFWC